MFALIYHLFLYIFGVILFAIGVVVILALALAYDIYLYFNKLFTNTINDEEISRN